MPTHIPIHGYGTLLVSPVQCTHRLEKRRLKCILVEFGLRRKLFQTLFLAAL